MREVAPPHFFHLVLIALVSFIAFRLSSTYALETRVAQLEALVKDGQEKSDVLDRVQMETLHELSQTVYGELEPMHKDPKTTTVRVTTVPLVRHERMMQEMQTRITQLERARLENQGQIRRLQDELRRLQQ